MIQEQIPNIKCEAITTKGPRCKNNKKIGNLCKTHHDIFEKNKSSVITEPESLVVKALEPLKISEKDQVGKCEAITANGVKCVKNKKIGNLCTKHHNILFKNELLDTDGKILCSALIKKTNLRCQSEIFCDNLCKKHHTLKSKGNNVTLFNDPDPIPSQEHINKGLCSGFNRETRKICNRPGKYEGFCSFHKKDKENSDENDLCICINQTTKNRCKYEAVKEGMCTFHYNKQNNTSGKLDKKLDIKLHEDMFIKEDYIPRDRDDNVRRSNTKYPYGDAVLDFLSYGYKLLVEEKDYLGIGAPLKCLCPNGHETKAFIYSLQKGYRECKACSKVEKRLRSRKSFDEIVKEAFDYGYNVTMLEKDYISARNGVSGYCSEGHFCTNIKIATLKSGKGCCRKCGTVRMGKGNMFSFDEFKEFSANSGYTLCITKEEYEGASHKYPAKCSQNHDCFFKRSNIIAGAGCCKICGMSKKGYKKYPYTFPSGKIEKTQGYEHFCLDDLLYKEGIKEEDIENNITKIPIIEYEYEGKERKYYPDMYIKSKNLIIEVKSTYTFRLQKRKNIAKAVACLENGYNFVFRIYSPEGDYEEIFIDMEGNITANN